MNPKTKLDTQGGFPQRHSLMLDFAQLRHKAVKLFKAGGQVKSANQENTENLYVSSEGLPFPSIEAYSAARIDFNAAGGEARKRMTFCEWIASGRP